MNPTVRLVGLTLLVLAGGRYSFDRLRSFSQIDPFAAFRPPKIYNPEDEIAVVLEGVQLRDYRSGKLVAKADAARIEVSKDRRSFELINVTNGFAPTKENGPTKFTAKRAFYDTFSGNVSVTEKATVTGGNYALNTPSLVYNANTNTIRADQGVMGNAMGGDTSAGSVTLNTETGAYKASGVAWQGNPAKATGTQDEVILKSWRTSAKEVESPGNGSSIQILKDASATDGEVLLKAPLIERNTKTDVITGTGRCFYYSAKANMVADKIVIYRDEKKAVLTGNVIVLSKPKDESTATYTPEPEKIPDRPDLKADAMEKPKRTYGPTPEEKELDKKLRDGNTARRFPLLIGADKVTYWYRKGERHAEIEGNPQARQELGKGRWRHIWTTTAYYDGENETLLAKSAEGKRDTRMKNSYGDDLTAREFFMHTSEGDDRYKGKDMDGDVIQEGGDEDDPRGNQNPTPPMRIGAQEAKPTPPPTTTPPAKEPEKKTGTR